MLIALRNQILKLLLLVFFVALCAGYLSGPINLTAVDVGRHIKNGSVLLSGHTDVLYRNFYSFTYPDYPFINHHWLTGVFFYWIHALGGFEGLAVFYIFLLLAAFLLFFDAARRMSSFPLAMVFSVGAFLFLIDRKEIRPEGLSIFFMGVYFYCLARFNQGSLDHRWLWWVLPLAQVIWVNSHIFFIMGPLLVAIFWAQAKINGKIEQTHILARLFLGVVLVNVINPSGLGGMLTPLNAFKQFGYPLVENQNIFFMIKRFPTVMIYKIYVAEALILLVGALLALYRGGWRQAPMAVLAMVVALVGFKAVRLMMPFGFFVIPLCAYFYAPFISQSKWMRGILMGIAFGGLVMAACLMPRGVKIGLMPAVNGSAEFFNQHNLKGPIFSNYDIGGYLIYHLSPQEKVFVDNRQEAFPPEFFNEVYRPMQEDPAVWRQVQTKFGFNVVYFYRHDLTPWGQQFLVRCVDDPQWAPIFVDAYAIIFARRGSVNQGIIDRFELPRSMFGVSGNPSGQSN